MGIFEEIVSFQSINKKWLNLTALIKMATATKKKRVEEKQMSHTI